MKKNVIALAIASAIAAPVAMADAPTVYGQVNMALQQKSIETAGVESDNDGTSVDSVASRLGVKGSEDLGNGLKAIYKLEFGVSIDDDAGKGTLTSRNQYVGLAGGFGTVLMGRHDTPTKMIQAKDLFNDGHADNSKMTDQGAFGKGMENRVEETLAYVSPSFSGVKLIAAFVPKEEDMSGSGLGDATEESSLTDLMSFGLTYGSSKKGLYLAAGMDMASDNAVDGDNNAQHTRVVAQYATGGLIANAMYQDFSGDALDDTRKGGTNIQANLGYKMGNIMPKAKISSVDRDKGFEDSTNYAVGLDYSFGKKTTGYVEYSMIENAKGVDESETTTVAVGLLHKF